MHLCRAELSGMQGAESAGHLAAMQRGNKSVAASVAPRLAHQRRSRAL